MVRKISSKNYVENVLRTESNDFQKILERFKDPKIIRLLHSGSGMCTETGEFFDAIKKHVFYGKPIDFVNLKEELGDLYWYIGLALDALETTMDEVLTTNIAKLETRYPEKFSEENALHRDLIREFEVLQQE